MRSFFHVVISVVLAWPSQWGWAAPFPTSVRDHQIRLHQGKLLLDIAGRFSDSSKEVSLSCDPVLSLHKQKFDGVNDLKFPTRGGPLGGGRESAYAVGFSLLVPPFVTPEGGVKCELKIVDLMPETEELKKRTHVFEITLDTSKIAGVTEALAKAEEQEAETTFAVTSTVDVINATVTTISRSPKAAFLEQGYDDLQADAAAKREPVFAPTIVERLSRESFQAEAHGGGQTIPLRIDPEDFRNLEVPLSVGVLLDMSGSMKELVYGATSEVKTTKRKLAEEAGRILIQNLMGLSFKDKNTGRDRKNNAFVLNFNELRFSLNGNLLPLDEKESLKLVNPANLLEAQSQLVNLLTNDPNLQRAGGTRLLDAIYRGAQELAMGKQLEVQNPPANVAAQIKAIDDRVLQEKRSYTKEELEQQRDLRESHLRVNNKAVLFVASDGLENGSQADLKDLIRYLVSQNVLVYGVSFTDSKAENPVIELAKATGGQAISIPSTLTAEESSKRMADFAWSMVNQLRRQYQFTFDAESNAKIREGCWELRMRAFDTRAIRTEWETLDRNYKFSTCQELPEELTNAGVVATSSSSSSSSRAPGYESEKSCGARPTCEEQEENFTVAQGFEQTTKAQAELNSCRSSLETRISAYEACRKQNLEIKRRNAQRDSQGAAQSSAGSSSAPNRDSSDPGAKSAVRSVFDQQARNAQKDNCNGIPNCRDLGNGMRAYGQPANEPPVMQQPNAPKKPACKPDPRAQKPPTWQDYLNTRLAGSNPPFLRIAHKAVLGDKCSAAEIKRITQARDARFATQVAEFQKADEERAKQVGKNSRRAGAVIDQFKKARSKEQEDLRKLEEKERERAKEKEKEQDREKEREKERGKTLEQLRNGTGSSAPSNPEQAAPSKDGWRRFGQKK